MTKEKRVGARDLRGFGRWLGAWRAALGLLLRGEPLPRRIVWTQDEAAALLAAGFPGLVAVPEALFAQTAALFPGRGRLAAAGRGEEELLAAIRAIEGGGGVRFDWDRFLARCERENRRARRLRALAETILALAPPETDTRSALAALRGLAEKNL